MKQTIPQTWEVLRIDGIDAKSFFIFVFWVVNEDENFRFSWELLWCEAKTDTMRFSGTNLADSNTQRMAELVTRSKLFIKKIVK